MYLTYNKQQKHLKGKHICNSTQINICTVKQELLNNFTRKNNGNPSP